MVLTASTAGEFVSADPTSQFSSEATEAPLPGTRRLFFGRLGDSLRFMAFKVGRAVLVVIAATIFTQWLFSLAPGGVAQSILGEASTPENVAALEAELGLDRSFFVRYFDWFGSVLQGDLGVSPITNQPVFEQILRALPVTLEIVALSTVIALSLALVTASLAARRPGGLVDRVLGVVTSVSLSIPTFVLGPILLYFLAFRANLFPIVGWTRLSDGVADNLRSAILPAVCVAIPEFAVFQRLFRGDLVSTLQEDFIDAARARGVSEGRIMRVHAFRPASVSLITVIGISVGRLLGGTVIVESLFSLPGIGQLLISAIIQRDLVTVQGIVVFVALAYVLINLLVDVLYGVIDPRIRVRGKS